ncbi:MAG: hypothetical protein ACO4CZ_16340, partial [Planctomycetota bacterium]
MRIPPAWLALVFVPALAAQDPPREALPTSFPTGVSRTWIGPWFWANRLQDWELRDGEAVCVRQDLPYRP